jgi:Sulfotransferase domain
LDQESAETSRVIRYVCIPGSPYTGSTLLGTLLNQHPDCASIGAAVGLIRRADLSTYRCSCGLLFRECGFWNDIAARTRALGHPVNVFETNFWNTHLRLSSNRTLNAMLVRSLGSSPVNDLRDAVVTRFTSIRQAIARMGWNTWALATAVLEHTGKAVFVDTSRDHQRPKYLAMHPRLDLKVIHLVRDPRGNSASIMKHTGTDVATAGRQWKRYNSEADRTRRYLPRDAWLSLRYEDLCRDPEGALDRISAFIGVRRARIQPRVGDHASHIIGNKMRLKALSEIREDRSWERSLNQADLDTLARITGLTSRRMGYDWP